MLNAAQRSPEFLDRLGERAALSQLVARARAAQSQVVVLRGEAGCGKTALLTWLAEKAEGCQVVWATGVQSEMELAFASLHSLCAPLLGSLERLPEPQRIALTTAFGLSAGPPPERFLVGMAVLGLLAEAADEQPLLCIVDDAQWLDRVSSQTLAFVARRLLAERVGLVFAVREEGGDQPLAGLPELVIGGLSREDARLLLDAMIRGPLDEQVKARILDETRGNPLALIELPRGLTPSELAGGFGLPDARPLTNRIERSFLQRVETLPRDSRTLLLTAAAEPVGDGYLLWRAAERLGIPTEAAAPAEAAGLIEIGARVRFPHPLVRSAIYLAANPSHRREVHRALADSTDPVLDPDRRAWHRAHAAAQPDEEVAAEMVRSADRAQGRGGLAAAAAFLKRAAELTPDARVRVERALTAAQAKLDVADFPSASALLDAAGLGPLDELQQARLERIRAEIVFATQRGRDAPGVLLDAAKRLEPLDPALACDTYLDAISSAMFAGQIGTDSLGREIAERAGAFARPSPLGVADLLLEGLVKRFSQGYAASVAPLARALRSLADKGELGADQRWLWLGCRLAQELWDDELWLAVATRGARIGRDTGRLTLLANSMNHLAAFHVHSGALATARIQLDEVDAVAEAAGLPPLKYSACVLAAARGDRSEMQVLWNTALPNAAERGESAAFGMYWCLSARLHNGHGHYDKALADARRAIDRDDIITSGWAMVEQVEAAIRIGDRNEAAGALDRLSERTRACGTAWALGIEARCRALVSDDEAGYRESTERLERSRAALELARTQLCYGEWLRRVNRRSDAREPLRAAHESFSRMGAEGFTERTRRELLATGETVRKRTASTAEALTPQEVHVAMMARDGHSNPEIGARLFISPRTVEYHLHKVFRKLGIAGRRNLRHALADGSQRADLSFS